MSSIEWVNEGRTAIINGWYFHFHEMYALRSEWSVTEWNRMELILKDPEKDLLAWYPSSYRCYSDKRILARCFFDEPENTYNTLVQEAYEHYLFEKAIGRHDGV